MSDEGGAQGVVKLGDVRVALVHEWISGIAGSEQTFAEMARLLPSADLFALGYNRDGSIDYGERAIETSFLDRFVRDGGRPSSLPFMPLAMGRLGRGRRYDVVITSSHAYARAFAHRMDAVHLSYTYTPIRYVWRPELERHRSRVPIPRPVLAPFRRLDLRYARGVDSFAAISEEVRSRIAATYGRDSVLVPPPCDTEFFTPPPEPRPRRGALVAGRLVSYKRTDLAIAACASAGVELTVVGDGPERSNLEALANRVAPGRVHFAGQISRHALREAYRTAALVIFPGIEDFGIVPVEAQASGAPVVALGRAGALETVLPHPYALVERQDHDLFATAIEKIIAQPPSEAACRRQAERFSYAIFGDRFSDWVTDAVSQRFRG